LQKKDSLERKIMLSFIAWILKQQKIWLP